MGDVTQITEAGRRRISAPCPLSRIHDTSRFDCGIVELNEWLNKTALKSQDQTAKTYAVCTGDRVVGFFTLAAGSVIRNELPSAKLRRNTPNNIPVVVLGRMAVDLQFQGMGIGNGMLKEAILRAIGASSEIAVKAIVVHAVNDNAVPFYLNYDFLLSPMNNRTLILPLSTAIAALKVEQ